jgi:hypothetical protein
MRRLEFQNDVDDRDRAVIEALVPTLLEYDHGDGFVFERVIVRGRYPDTDVTIVYTTPFGERSRTYVVHKQFWDDDPFLITTAIWTDLNESLSAG